MVEKVFLGLMMIQILPDLIDLDRSDDPPDTQIEAGSDIPEKQVWADFANWVETNPSGEVVDTDFVIKMALILKENGSLTSISRLDPLLDDFQKLDDSNRKSISAMIRGKDEKTKK